MKTIEYKLSKGLFLSQIEPFKTEGLPTDSFIHKVVPGCGATTLELEYNRNSIIIEPNVPVIVGKCNKMNIDEQGRKLRKNKKVMGVYEGVTVEDIRAYIKNCKGFKKILVTPEGFKKVFEAIGETMYTDYFLLFDECEKAIQDIDYRQDIINPIDYFFYFKQKAFVSATPIIPSDERFNDFQLVEIMPDYDFKQEITVTTTNNVIFHLKKLIDSYKPYEKGFDRKLFIFVKSTNLIMQIIKGLDIVNESAVYCAESSTSKLIINGVKNVYTNLNDKFQKFNFITNRYFSAVDVDYDMYRCNPIIIILSDVVAVEHTAIDPHTESVQICGRFRRPLDEEKERKLKKDIHHISNINHKLTNFDRNQINAILEDKKKIHDFLTNFKPKSDIEYITRFIDAILEINGFECFMRNGQLNPYMVDNFVNMERVKGYYRTRDLLIEEYGSSLHFSLHNSSGHKSYNITDEELAKIRSLTGTVTLNHYFGELLRKSDYGEEGNLVFILNADKFKKQMSMLHDYGIENAKKIGFDFDKIEQFLKDKNKLNGLLPIIKHMHGAMDVENFYSECEIKEILTDGINKTGLTKLSPNVKLLKNGFNLSERTSRIIDGKKVNGYIIKSKTQNL